MAHRLIRVLVYEGSPQWIQYCLATHAVKGSYTVPNGFIREAIVGDFLEEILEKDELPSEHHVK